MRALHFTAFTLLLLVSAACAHTPAPTASPQTSSGAPRCVDIFSTSDLHGALDRLPTLGGYLTIARRQLGAENVVMLDAGDLYQGTLESNLSHGASVIDAYNALGMTAAAVGNHEFDFGLEEFERRAAQARFPFLAANIRTRTTNMPLPFVPKSLLHTRGNVKVGIIGAATPDTPNVTLSVNVAKLNFSIPDADIIAEARDLRARGAELIVLTVHMGGLCKSTANPRDLSPCPIERDSLIPLLQRLPPGTVNIAVGGHTHHLMAHWVGDTATIQAGARAEYLARVRACVDGASGAFDPAHTTLYAPVAIEPEPATYMDQPVVTDAHVADVLAPYRAEVVAMGARVITTLPKPLLRSQKLGVMVADAMRLAVKADFGVQNRGGVRIDLAAGPLTYAQLFALLPFENRLVTLQMTGTDVQNAIVHLTKRAEGIVPFVAGMTVNKSLGGKLTIRLPDGRLIDPAGTYTLATNDFLVGGGEGFNVLLSHIPDSQRFMSTQTIRDAFEQYLVAQYLSAK